jgi:hypothetical protein
VAKLKKVISKAQEKQNPTVKVAPAYVPLTPISHAERKAIYKALEVHWEEQAEHYGWDDPDRPEVVVKRMQAVLGAVDRETAALADQKARMTIQTMILGAWARGKIPGPTTEISVERQVKRAESLAQMLEKKGQLEAAERQWARASQLRLQLEEIREESKP